MNQDLIIKIQTYIAKLQLSQILLDSMPLEKAKTIIKAVTNIDIEELEKQI